MGPAYRCDNHTEFVCKTNYRCVPLWSVCNGQNDCRDNSDEQGCGESLPFLKSADEIIVSLVTLMSPGVKMAFKMFLIQNHTNKYREMQMQNNLKMALLLKLLKCPGA